MPSNVTNLTTSRIKTSPNDHCARRSSPMIQLLRSGAISTLSNPPLCRHTGSWLPAKHRPVPRDGARLPTHMVGISQRLPSPSPSPSPSFLSLVPSTHITTPHLLPYPRHTHHHPHPRPRHPHPHTLNPHLKPHPRQPSRHSYSHLESSIACCH